MCSVQLIISILRHTFISKFSNLVMSFFLIVLISAQYKVTLQEWCFHHSFLEASTFFSILPLVFLSSWKRLLSHCYPGASILELKVATPRFWAGSRRVGRRGSLESWTGREILLYLIMYRKYAWKWLLLKRNRIICPEVAVGLNGQCFAWKIDFFNCLKKSKFSEIFLQNSISFCKIAWKFWNLPVEIEILLTRINDVDLPPRFQTKLTPLLLSFSWFLCGIIGDHAS